MRIIMVTYENYKEYWVKKRNCNVTSKKLRKTLLRKWAKKCAAILKERFHATSIYLIGSLTGDHTIHTRSDIDLAVDGLAEEQYYKAVGELLIFLSPHIDASIDLIPLSDAIPSMRQVIETQGELL